eukprot:m.77206 g.77206  ORF g.77206 m.77206 type:complete len:437 (-) comp11906_c0_seq1:1104-2414(-)
MMDGIVQTKRFKDCFSAHLLKGEDSDWLACNDEPGQTFEEYLCDAKELCADDGLYRPTRTKHKIYLQPIGEVDSDIDVSWIQQLVSEFYVGVEVVVSEAWPIVVNPQKKKKSTKKKKKNNKKKEEKKKNTTGKTEKMGGDTSTSPTSYSLQTPSGYFDITSRPSKLNFDVVNVELKDKEHEAKEEKLIGEECGEKLLKKPKTTLNKVMASYVKDAQFSLNDLIDAVLYDMPDDCFCRMGIASVDMFEEEDDEFCMGRAYGASHGGVIGVCRYSPSLLPPYKEFGEAVMSRSQLFTSRVAKTVVHEIGHCFMLDHCTAHRCLMNGSGSLKEDISIPSFFCPHDLRKIAHACDVIITRKVKQNGKEKKCENDDVDVFVKRYETLIGLYKKQSMKREAAFLRTCKLAVVSQQQIQMANTTTSEKKTAKRRGRKKTAKME